MTGPGFAETGTARIGWLTFLLALSCGLIAGNLYYAQPLVGSIARDLALTPEAQGLIVTLGQVGYVLGLLLIVPLADRVENRRLVLTLLVLAGAGLMGVALAPSGGLFLLAMFVVGLGSVGIQVLVPFAAHMAPEAIRGRVVGNVMSGLMLGIMTARPLSSFIADLLSWQAVFFLSAGAMVVLLVVHRFFLPRRDPNPKPRYGDLMLSMVSLILTMPDLRRRALAHAGLFAAFSLFWTTAPLYLSGPAFNLSLAGIGWVSLAGVAGAVAAPIAGRIADRGWGFSASITAMCMVALSFPMTFLGETGSNLALGLVVAAAILIDFGVTMNLVVNQRVIFSQAPEIRGRLNGLYMAIFFMGGALGSALGGWAFAVGDWKGASLAGFLFPVAALGIFLWGGARLARSRKG
ncbi:MAG: MFS transporter [Rhodospirillum sp.]|nr:MFS transporter [Rhodospirillum sp.]MCF8490046.1 MFS transporter [Rhodospirillum sp.]MCF8499549.1 MFS transporter [Rhodospirillum sp.]